MEKLPQDIYFNAGSFAKIIMICENNYSRENNQRFIVDVGQGSEYVSDFEYATVLKIAGLWICRGSKYGSGSEYVRVLDLPQF